MAELVSTIGWPLLGIVVGGVVTWAVARHYYRKAAKDLRSEAAQLIQKTTLVLRALEEGGVAEFSRDGSGDFVGLVLKIGKVALHGEGAMTARVTVRRPEETTGNDDG